MPAAPQRTRLEPLPGPILAVALAHLLLGMLIWILLPLWPKATTSRTAETDLVWLPPAAFTIAIPTEKAPPIQAPPPPAPKPVSKPAPTAVTLAGTPPLRAPNKYITLSARDAEIEGPPAPPKPYKPVPSLLDIAIASQTVKEQTGGIDMGAVDEAVQQTYLKEWTAPSTHLVPPGQRTAVVNVSIGKDGTIAEATLVKTGAPALNVSITQLLQRVQKIPMTLPSGFRKERYDLQVNFQIE